MGSTNTNARVAGFLYLLLAIVGPVRLIYIPRGVVVHGNALATAANIAAHASLFRFGIVTALIAAILTLFVTLALYRLLSAVDPVLAAMMVILGGLMVTPIAFVNAVIDAGALIVVEGADFLSAFDAPQRDGLAVLFVRLQHEGIVANEIFWGLWLFPLAVLVFKSRLVPRFLAVWLILNGLAYLAISVTGLTVPEYEARVSSIVFPALTGELALVLWLLVMGTRETPAFAAAT